MAAKRPRVLVIGSGFAGVSAAQALSKAADVTIVSKTDYFEITWAQVRSVVDLGVFEKSNISLTQVPGIGKVVQGVVASLGKDSATLTSGEVIPFDYAVIASGSSHSGSFGKSFAAATRQDRLQEMKDIIESIKNAKSVLVVGGGPTGVEVAAEIVETYAGKKVTIVTAGPQILEGKDAKLVNFATKWLTGHGVQFIYNDRIDQSDQTSGTFTTRGGKAVEADVVLWSLGITPNTGFLAGGDLAAAVNDKGYIKVDPFLHVEGTKNIFAVGDCNNVPETKLGFLADIQAKCAAANLLAEAAGVGKVKAYTPGGGLPPAMFASLGRASGVAHIGGCGCTGFMPKKMKSENLNVDKWRAQLKIQ